ncbi:Conserved_hypothetical protein [Hexamita inflata]|uniref:Uncharacterized protein n=1 Tax=Hexamita inflata TaxID=28002 RepID=A0AA86UKR8_9EUKA|nr:Conserved hypothetical protein [Hexamita inflata]
MSNENEPSETDTSLQGTGLSATFQDFQHIYGPKKTKCWPFPEILPEDYSYFHVVVDKQGTEYQEDKVPQNMKYYILPVQPQTQLCDDPSNPYFYVNEPHLFFPDAQIELPHPGLLIRPVSANLVQGLTPSGTHVVCRCTEQAEIYCKKEDQLARIVHLLAYMMNNALIRANTTQQLINNCVLKLERNDNAYLEFLAQNKITLKELDLDSNALLIEAAKSRLQLSDFLKVCSKNLDQYNLTPNPQRIPFINQTVDPEKLIDNDELDIIDQLNPDLYHDQFSSYLKQDSGIVILTEKQRVYAKKICRRHTVYKTATLLLQLVTKSKESPDTSQTTTTQTNREKYLDRGFEDEAGDCKVCAKKYKSYFGHIETPEHVQNYKNALNGALNKKFQYVERESESCLQFIKRHMLHLEKRSQLISQMQFVANELAYKQKISYSEACNIMTRVCYESRVNLRIDATDRMNRSTSPTLKKKEVKRFYEENRQKKADDLEFKFGKINENEKLIQQYSNVYAKLLVQIRPEKEVKVQSGRNGRFTVEHFIQQNYSQFQLDCFANMVNFVESHLELIFKPIHALDFDIAKLNEDLKKFEVDVITGLIVDVVRFIKGALQKCNMQHKLFSEHKSFLEIEYQQYEAVFTEPFANREEMQMRVPQYFVINEKREEFEKQLKNKEFKQYFQQLIILNEEYEPVIIEKQVQDDLIIKEKQRLHRCNSIDAMRVDENCLSLQLIHFSVNFVADAEPKINKSLLQQFLDKQKILEDAIDTGILSYNAGYGMNPMDTTAVYLNAADLARQHEAEMGTGCGRTMLHFVE